MHALVELEDNDLLQASVGGSDFFEAVGRIVILNSAKVPLLKLRSYASGINKDVFDLFQRFRGS
jgi:hypothetical protein